MKVKMINISDKQNEFLEKVMKDEEVTFTSLIRGIIDNYIEKKKMEGETCGSQWKTN